jgi:hypothetical protein
MPPAPEGNIITRYILENPWPLGMILLAVAGVLAWKGFREGMATRLRVAAALAAAGAVVLVTGIMVVTSGEHAVQTTRALIESVVREDLVAADRLLSDDAAITIGSPSNPGQDKFFILSSLEDFATRESVESNSITAERGYSESSNVGIVHLSCTTIVERFPYPTLSRWIMRVERQTDDQWRVTRMTCISINNQTPSMNMISEGGR